MAKTQKERNFVDWMTDLFLTDERRASYKEGYMGARSVTIQVTDACNLACTYCYQINKKTHVIPVEYGKKFIDDLLDGKYDKYCPYDKSEGIILEYIGGEPFLQIDLIDELTTYFIQRMVDLNHRWLYRYRISICSNGTLYFNPKVQEFLNKHRYHLSFSISIDGNKKLHDSCRVFHDGTGSYDIAMSAVQHYRKNYGDVTGSKMTLSPNNIQYTDEALRGLIASGYTMIHANCVYEEGWNIEHAKVFYQQLKQLANYMIITRAYDTVDLSLFNEIMFCPKAETDVNNWCGGTGSMLAIDWKGDLYPCIRYMESSLGDKIPPVIIGNVNEGILCNESQCKICEELNAIDRRTQSTDECFYCPIAAGCSWCSAYNYQLFGTANKRATFICCMHKARALANVYYWNMIYRLNKNPTRFYNHTPKEWALEIIDEDEWNFLNALAEENEDIDVNEILSKVDIAETEACDPSFKDCKCNCKC